MSIVHARVDERLIHGQVAMVWSRITGCERIIVANDEATHNDLLVQALKMSKPSGIKLSILSLNRAIQKIKEGTYDNEKIFLITKNISDMKWLIDNGLDLKRINVGNVAKQEGSIPIKKSVSLTEKEIIDIRELIKKGVIVTAQMVPTESDCSIEEYLPKEIK